MKYIIENWREYIRKPNEERPCLTPDAMYDIHISDKKIGVTVRLPEELDITEEQAIELENDMHDAMEAILARFFEQTS